ncbi:glycerophosphodiester phosphodiesterase [Lysinibacillus sp. 2017]|uniref:glycerophosphodiester phosphodiesterase n=1 Tax=unclassified Lysinibacillus TaxID=2636778 RepID=UPI000D52819A|nr:MULTISPECIES: glycerophosphodiester phosphodiesterase family protein [unclassified Lysinibacillus]AWE07880.1 glycerophosphodiester phosphodiesterase [Lysinibacillus sp. 2017]TGN31845.1 glycerophosphodiester phosphodiesterase [Lysinibacillus sp. S2017]
MNKIPIFAHRGATSYAVENTMKAFQKAKSLGVDGIELDLQLSKDAVFIVFHDLDLLRLTGVRKLVSNCTFDELMSFNLGTKFKRRFSRHRMMAFQDIVKWANEENMALNIELKESILNNEDVLREVLQSLELPENSHFSSFYEPLLKVVKETRPQYETALIITKKFDWQTIHGRTTYDVIHANKKYYKPQYLKYCDEAKIGIRFYGIEGKESYLANPHPAVIGWITDYPEKVRKAQLK